MAFGQVAVLGEARVAAQVGHEHGDLALVTAEAEPVRRLQHGPGHLPATRSGRRRFG